jgi:hypothetical protein
MGGFGQERRGVQTFRNPLDPLVSALASSYADSRDLARRLDDLFVAGPPTHFTTDPPVNPRTHWHPPCTDSSAITDQM